MNTSYDKTGKAVSGTPDGLSAFSKLEVAAQLHDRAVVIDLRLLSTWPLIFPPRRLVGCIDGL